VSHHKKEADAMTDLVQIQKKGHKDRGYSGDSIICIASPGGHCVYDSMVSVTLIVLTNM
jgi:hypothetical protein